jgi:copper chaperone CopZ
MQAQHNRVWIGFLILLVALAPLEADFQEVNQQVRDVAVAEKLKVKPKAIILYAKGMCCPSCAIGIRRTIGRLKFVDRKAAEKGVLLDAKHQLVTVTIKNNASPDLSALAQALDDAGYDAVHAYTLVSGEVLTTSISNL